MPRGAKPLTVRDTPISPGSFALDGAGILSCVQNNRLGQRMGKGCFSGNVWWFFLLWPKGIERKT